MQRGTSCCQRSGCPSHTRGQNDGCRMLMLHNLLKFISPAAWLCAGVNAAHRQCWTRGVVVVCAESQQLEGEEVGGASGASLPVEAGVVYAAWRRVLHTELTWSEKQLWWLEVHKHP